MLRITYIFACATLTGVIAASGTTVFLLNTIEADVMARLRNAPTSSSSSCPNTGLDLDEADRRHRDFMRGVPEPMTGNRRF